jgi:hypothetical protein
VIVNPNIMTESFTVNAEEATREKRFAEDHGEKVHRDMGTTCCHPGGPGAVPHPDAPQVMGHPTPVKMRTSAVKQRDGPLSQRRTIIVHQEF